MVVLGPAHGGQGCHRHEYNYETPIVQGTGTRMSTGNLVAQHRDEPGDGAGETSDDVHCQDGKKGWLVGWERNPADDDWPWLIPEDYSHLAKRTYRLHIVYVSQDI